MSDSSTMTPESLRTLLESQNKLIEKLTQTVEALGGRVPSDISAPKTGLSLNAIREFYESLTRWTCPSKKADSASVTPPPSSAAKGVRTPSSPKTAQPGQGQAKDERGE
jgi:hypothetical protein